MNPPSSSSSVDRSHSTIRPPPPPRPNQSLIEQSLEVTALPDLGPNIYTNTRPIWLPLGARGVYGGSVIAQSLLAAQKTVPDGFYPHSFHSYFVLAGDSDLPIIYHVEDVRASSRSFATREIKAKQKGKTIFIGLASFQKTLKKGHGKSTAGHQAPMPTNLIPPEELENEDDSIARLETFLQELKQPIRGEVKIHNEKEKNDINGITVALDERAYLELSKSFQYRKHRASHDPFIWKRIGGGLKDHHPSTPIHQRKFFQYVKSRHPISDGPEATYNQIAALAYFTDLRFIATLTRVNPQAERKNVGMSVSLDHTIYFHLGRDTKVDGDGWLLVEMDSPWMGDGRGLVTQRIWRRSDGELVATCIQEGLIRFKDGMVGHELKEANGEQGISSTGSADNLSAIGKTKSSHKL